MERRKAQIGQREELNYDRGGKKFHPAQQEVLE